VTVSKQRLSHVFRHGVERVGLMVVMKCGWELVGRAEVILVGGGRVGVRTNPPLAIASEGAGREPNIIGGERSTSRSEGGHCGAVRC